MRTRMVTALFVALTAVASAQTGDRSLRTAHGLLGRGLHAQAIPEYQDALAAITDPEQRLEALYGLGVALARTGQPEPALEALQEVSAATGARYAADASALCVELLAAGGKFAAAADTAERFFAEHPEHQANAALAAIAIESRQRAGQPRQAIRLFDQQADRLRRVPSVGQRAALYAGVAAGSLGEHDRATAIFRELAQTAVDPSIAEQARLRLGTELFSQRLYPPAVEALRAASKAATPLTQNHADMSLGMALRLAGEPAESVGVLRQIRERAPQFEPARIMFELGVAQLEAGDAAESRRSLEQAIQRTDAETTPRSEQPSKRSTSARYWLARAELADGATAAGVDRLAKLLASSSGAVPAEARFELAAGLEELGARAEAIEAYGLFRREHPRHAAAPNALYAESALSLDVGDLDRARELAVEFVDRHSDSAMVPAASFIAGESLYRDGVHAEATEWFNSAVSDALDPELRARSGYRLGMSLHQMGEDDSAEPHLLSAAENGRFPPALKALGDIATARQQWSAAEAWYAAFLAGATSIPTTVEADAMLRRGIALARLGEPERAAPLLRRVLGHDAEAGEVLPAQREHARFELGQALLTIGDLEEARELLEQSSAVADSRFAPFALRHLAWIESAEGNASAAADFMARASDAGVGAETDLARAFVAAGRPGDALSALDGVEGSEAEAWRIIALSASGEHEVATRRFDVARLGSLTDDLARLVRYHAARSHNEVGAIDEAVELFERVRADAARDPISSHASVELAVLLAAQGDRAAAEPILVEILASRALPADLCSVATYQLAWLLSTRGAHDGVRDLLMPNGRTCELGEYNARADLLLGIAYHSLGQPALASERLERAVRNLEAAEERSDALLRLGESYATEQRWADSARALADHAERYADDPLWFRARFGLGWAIENGGDPQRAIQHYQAVTERHAGATAARAQFQIGQCYFALGEHERAIRELLRVDILHAEPQWSAAALYEAGRCFEALNKPGEARAQYRDVVARFGESAWAPAARERLAALADTSQQRRSRRGSGS